MKREESILCPNFVYFSYYWQNNSYINTPSAAQKDNLAFENTSFHTPKEFPYVRIGFGVGSGLSLSSSSAQTFRPSALIAGRVLKRRTIGQGNIANRTIQSLWNLQLFGVELVISAMAAVAPQSLLQTLQSLQSGLLLREQHKLSRGPQSTQG